jgi:hypothetical protein
MLTLLMRFGQDFEEFLSNCNWFSFMTDQLFVLRQGQIMGILPYHDTYVWCPTIFRLKFEHLFNPKPTQGTQHYPLTQTKAEIQRGLQLKALEK